VDRNAERVCIQEFVLATIRTTLDSQPFSSPTKYNIPTIGGKLGVNGWLSKRKDKLPITKAYIESMMESITDFQVRKIKWAIDELERQGIELTKWNLVEMAGVKPKYFKDILDDSIDDKDLKSSILIK